MDMDEWYTTDEVAKLLKVHPESVRRWLRTGEMRGSQLGDRTGWRVSREEVGRFMRERENIPENGRSGRPNESG
jgi:excisionase family DNA binding protein